MAVATALGGSDLRQIGLAVGLAFLFGYTLTSIPLFRAGLRFAAALPIILATDTVSIAIMEVVDNLVVFLVPGAMEASVLDPLLWGSVALGLWWPSRSPGGRTATCWCAARATRSSTSTTTTRRVRRND